MEITDVKDNWEVSQKRFQDAMARRATQIAAGLNSDILKELKNELDKSGKKICKY